MNALPNYDTWKLAAPDDDDGPEPSEEHFDEAFAELVQDSQLLADFVEAAQPDYTTAFQLFHRHGGLPSSNGTERDDALIDSWQITMTNFFDHYRSWLGTRLDDRADALMRAEIQAAKDEAAESRFDDREAGF